MLVVGVMLYNSAATGMRSYVPGRLRRYGPFLVFCLAAPLILADIVRHLLQDSGVWPECGNNPYYSRVNTTDPFPPGCYWSSAQYRCEKQCCVSVWQKAEGAHPKAEYEWVPPSPDFFPAKEGAEQFVTMRPNGSLYFPAGFDKEAWPYLVYEAPLVLFDDGSRNPLTQPKARDCPHGLNEATGYCYLAAEPPTECSCESCLPDSHENMLHLSPMGWLFTFFFTYSGFTLLAVAVLWNANFLQKLRTVRKKWAELRAKM